MKPYSKNILFTLLICTCYHGGFAQVTAERQIIAKINKEYFVAVEKKDVAAFIKQYTDSCWIMAPNLPIYCGPDAPSDYFREVLLKKGIARGKFITIDLYGVQEDVMAEVGLYQFYNQSGIQFDDGKYVMLWTKVDGQWMRYRETLISSRPTN